MLLFVTKKSFLQKRSLFFLVFLQVFCASCTSLKESSKYEFSDGIYKARFENKAPAKVYIHVHEEQINLYPLIGEPGKDAYQLDTTNSIVLPIPLEQDTATFLAYSFSNPSFDIDVLTIPFKFRPGTAGMPPQLNTDFQGAIFIGGRRDIFKVKYDRNPVGKYIRKFNHIGYSLGAFTGLGTTAINEFVTSGQVAYEYDGAVWLNGVAGIIGFNNFTLGMAIGTDFLVDKNRKEWIYQHKPWVGLAFGLNLN